VIGEAAAAEFYDNFLQSFHIFHFTFHPPRPEHTKNSQFVLGLSKIVIKVIAEAKETC
jgi:hypothetical protein